MEFKEFLRKQRVEREISIKDLATKTGISASYLSQLETGVRQPPTAGKLKLIAAALGLPVEVLMNIADQALYTEDYLEANLDYSKLHRQLKEIADLTKQTLISESELTNKYNLTLIHQNMTNLMSKIEGVEKLLKKVATTHQSQKYPLPVENIVEDLMMIGVKGQEYVRMQIAVFKEMFLDKSATV